MANNKCRKCGGGIGNDFLVLIAGNCGNHQKEGDRVMVSFKNNSVSRQNLQPKAVVVVDIEWDDYLGAIIADPDYDPILDSPDDQNRSVDVGDVISEELGANYLDVLHYEKVGPKGILDDGRPHEDLILLRDAYARLPSVIDSLYSRIQHCSNTYTSPVKNSNSFNRTQTWKDNLFDLTAPQAAWELANSSEYGEDLRIDLESTIAAKDEIPTVWEYAVDAGRLYATPLEASA